MDTGFVYADKDTRVHYGNYMKPQIEHLAFAFA